MRRVCWLSCEWLSTGLSEELKAAGSGTITMPGASEGAQSACGTITAEGTVTRKSPLQTAERHLPLPEPRLSRLGPDVVYQIPDADQFSHITTGYIHPAMLEPCLREVVRMLAQRVEVVYASSFNYNWECSSGATVKGARPHRGRPSDPCGVTIRGKTGSYRDA